MIKLNDSDFGALYFEMVGDLMMAHAGAKSYFGEGLNETEAYVGLSLMAAGLIYSKIKSFKLSNKKNKLENKL